jgi:predicted nucleic acid-binding protein
VIVVADAGPLIALAKVDALELLFDVCGPVEIAGAVYEGVIEAGRVVGAEDVARLDAALHSGRLRVVQVVVPSEVVNPALGAGETESIQLALDRRAEWLLVDERRARGFAAERFAAMGRTTLVKGTLGLIATAVTQQRMERARAIQIVVALQARPDVWIANSLCEKMLQALRAG